VRDRVFNFFTISTVDRNAKAKEESVVSVTLLFSCFGEEDLLS
jgi:hypothetical protein